MARNIRIEKNEQTGKFDVDLNVPDGYKYAYWVGNIYDIDNKGGDPVYESAWLITNKEIREYTGKEEMKGIVICYNRSGYTEYLTMDSDLSFDLDGCSGAGVRFKSGSEIIEFDTYSESPSIILR